MIPVLQFDPSSLSLWYDAQLIGACRGSEELGLAFEYAVLGDDRGLRQLIDCVEDPWIQTRAANIASTVWHEKRHFLDFVLTNYGALRVRHFFEMYGNAGPLLTLAGESKELLVPLDSYLDRVTREMMNIGEPDERVLQIARQIAKRKAMLSDDRRPLESRFGLMDIGGEAIFEAIAYHVQHAKLHRVFGRDMNHRVQHDHPGDHVIHYKYKWAYEALLRTGLLRSTVAESDPNLLLIDDAPLLPLCYGALAARVWGQPQTQTDSTSSYLPAERLSSLITTIRDTHPNYCETPWEEAWEIVNTTARRIFGRTIIEETEVDFEYETRAIERYQENHAGTPFLKAYEDLHALRGRAFDLLKREPGLFLDQAAWSDEMVNRTKPAIVVAAPGGAIGVPPQGFDRICGYTDPNESAEQMPEARWWWAAMKTDWPQVTHEHDICMRDLESWASVAGEYAPLAKLLYSGQDMRAMLGPELISARVRYQHQTGIKIILDPAFAYPNVNHDAAWWFFITGRNEFRCQLSNETVCNPEGVMLDAWDVRRRPGLREAMLGACADTKRMRFTFWRDWSPWMVSEEFREFLESFELDDAGLYEML